MRRPGSGSTGCSQALRFLAIVLPLSAAQAAAFAAAPTASAAFVPPLHPEAPRHHQPPHTCAWAASSSSPPSPQPPMSPGALPPAPLVVYLTPGVPEGGGEALEAWYRKVGECAAAGVAIVQLRDKRLSPTELLPHARRCRELVDAAATTAAPGRPRMLLLINGRIDVALACGADGVHLPEAMMDEVPVLKEQGRLLVGASVHSVEAALRAAALGVDVLQVGTMFPTGSHPEKGAAVEGPGLMAQVDAALRAAGRRGGLALVGVGGIGEGNCGEVVRAGADGVAVISGLAAPGREARGTVAALEAAMRQALDDR